MNCRMLEFQYVPKQELLLKRLGLDADSDEAEEFLELLAAVAPLAKPVAAVGIAKVETGVPAPGIVIGGVEFHGTALYDNVAEADVVWPYVATCGRRVYDFVAGMDDPFERFWAEEVMEDALDAALEGVAGHFADTVYGGKTTQLSPGSLEGWPLEEQAPLFRLLGEGADRCGVTLTDSLVMLPNKSVSGIRFPSEHDYVSCSHCPRLGCQKRKAEYLPPPPA